MHDLDFTKGVAAIAYTGDTPWHGYGERLLGDEPLEHWIIRAGLDYEIIERPIALITNRRFDDEGNPISDTSQEMLDQLRLQEKFDLPKFSTIKGKKALCRSDTGDQLSIVTDRYNVVQPKEVMEFFRDLVDDQGFKLHTAGVLKDGNRVWALAETGKEFAVKGEDRIGGYLLLATSYDGKFSTTAQFTSVRVVCNNTLSWSLGRGENQNAGIVRIPHTAEFDATKVKEELGLLGALNTAGWQNFQENVVKLSEYTVSKRRAIEFFLELLDVNEEASGRQLQSTKKLISFYESGPGSKFIGSHNTTWGLVNAVSFFTDHARRGRVDRRFDSASFGSGAQLKQKAFEKALDMADAA